MLVWAVEKGGTSDGSYSPFRRLAVIILLNYGDERRDTAALARHADSDRGLLDGRTIKVVIPARANECIRRILRIPRIPREVASRQQLPPRRGEMDHVF